MIMKVNTNSEGSRTQLHTLQPLALPRQKDQATLKTLSGASQEPSAGRANEALKMRLWHTFIGGGGEVCVCLGGRGVVFMAAVLFVKKH